MDIERILEILVDSLAGNRDDGSLRSGSEVVDLYTMKIGIDPEKARGHADEMARLLEDWPEQTYGSAVPKLGSDINYIIAGAVLGSQQTAFMLFAFGKVLGWWQILDPKVMLNLEPGDPVGEQLAGMGFVAINGYHPNSRS